MKFNPEMPLDELFHLVLTDDSLAYNPETVKKLKTVMLEKVANIQDTEEQQYYAEIVDELIFEMNESLEESGDITYFNPIQREYEHLEHKLIQDAQGVMCLFKEAEKLLKNFSDEVPANHSYVTPTDNKEIQVAPSALKSYAVKTERNNAYCSQKTGYTFEENRAVNNILFKIKK